MAINTRLDPFLNKAIGKGFEILTTLTSSGSGTAAASGSGNISIKLNFNVVGTTIPTTLVSVPYPPALSTNLLFKMCSMNSASARAGYLVNLYKIGTLDLSSTGDKFTHDSATFPLLRKVYGQASQPIDLIPLIYVTTATATSAPIIRLRTAGGAAGYTDQDGNSTVGTISFTFPSATTAVESCYILRLENGDGGIRDISNIEVTTAGTAGAATIFGMEILSSTNSYISGVPSSMDGLFGGLSACDIYPAVATSGTATTILCHANFAVTTSTSTYLSLKGFLP